MDWLIVVRSNSAALKKKLPGPAHTASQLGMPAMLAPNSKNMANCGWTHTTIKERAPIAVAVQVYKVGAMCHASSVCCDPVQIIKVSSANPIEVKAKLRVFMSLLCPRSEEIMSLYFLYLGLYVDGLMPPI